MNYRIILNKIRSTLDSKVGLHFACIKAIENGNFIFRKIASKISLRSYIESFKTRYYSSFEKRSQDYEGLITAIQQLESSNKKNINIFSLINDNGEFKIFMDNKAQVVITIYHDSATTIDQALQIEKEQKKSRW